MAIRYKLSCKDVTLVELRPDKHSDKITNVYILGRYMLTFCPIYVILNLFLGHKVAFWWGNFETVFVSVFGPVVNKEIRLRDAHNL